MNHKKIQRLWRAEGLRVPQTRRRKRIGSATAGYQVKAAAPGDVWALDFQFDATENGKAIKICTIIDEHTRQVLGGIVARSITAPDVTAELDRIAVLHGGYPKVLRSDNGPEFISQKLTTWAENRVGLAYIPPGQPWRNGYVESFNSRIRDECLNLHSFFSLLHARVVIGDWKEEYNTKRRHSSLGYLTPNQYAEKCTHQS